MTPEAQRIAIGDACPRAVRKTVTVITGYGFDEEEVTIDPLTDLNAMHVAEKVLTSGQRQAYGLQIAKLCDRSTWHATAAQRAEAFLRTLSKWTD